MNQDARPRMRFPRHLLLALLIGLVACVQGGVERPGMSPAPMSGVGSTTSAPPAGPSLTQDPGRAIREALAPELGSGYRPRPVSQHPRHMIVTANPYATQAGLTLLRAGGSAFDAAAAASLVLGLVEPQSSGIGGGGFLVAFDASTQKVRTFDGRETAPAAATPDMLLGPDAKPRPFADVQVGGLSVATPALLKMLWQAHQVFGKADWKALFAPAIQLAEEGFQVSPRLNMLITKAPALASFAPTRDYFFLPDGQPIPVGFVRTNWPYAALLKRVQAEGISAFYQGTVADDIVTAVQKAPRNPGILSQQDMASYRAVERPPLCRPTLGHFVCGMGPPSSGTVAILQISGMLEALHAEALEPHSVAALHAQLEASRLAFADRALYLADPDAVPVPVDGLLSPEYLRERATLIQAEKSLGKASPGTLAQAFPYSSSPHDELPATTHLVVVDAQGNAISMTNTIEAAFGSHLMVHGFLLNNELTDFAFAPLEADRTGTLQPVANRIAPGKRPRSSMSPLLVLTPDARQVTHALGSPGGAQIIGYVARALTDLLLWKQPLDAVLKHPHFINRNDKSELERVPGYETWLESSRAGLSALGHEVVERELTSGLHIIVRTPEGLLGGVDPRREGHAAGD